MSKLIAQIRSGRGAVLGVVATHLRVGCAVGFAVAVAVPTLRNGPLWAEAQASAGSVMTVDAGNQGENGDAGPSARSRRELGGGAHGENAKPEQDKELTPAEKMQKRLPQPVRVGDLIGRAVLDDDDMTLGIVTDVVRAAGGKTVLIVDYSAWFGWFGHPVAVPIEVVALIGKNIAALDMPRDDFVKAPTWKRTGETPIPRDDKIRIAVARR